MSHPVSFSSLQVDADSALQFRQRVQAQGVAPRARLLLLHGVGGNESNLAGLAQYLPADLDVLLLRGPLQIAAQGFAWFQVNFSANGPVINAEQAEASRQQLLTFIQARPALPTVIAGFSQGGILSASVGLSAPGSVAGFALLSGRILPELEPHIATAEALRTLSAFVAHGRHDDKLPLFWAERADAWLTRLGVEHQTRLYDMGHEIVAEEVSDFVQWLDAPLQRH
ncbi:alpha/beta hydrolase [Pseudomonas panipatensis]|uniref:alpha/beta hydrolase n=1 Tax=Pseudomonas panipatensis TaxID=428992 RepID=UPI0035B1B632